MDIFEECIRILGDYIKAQKSSENENKKIANLNKLYSIAFIKIYLKKFVDSIDKFNDDEINIILSKINDEDKFSCRRM